MLNFPKCVLEVLNGLKFCLKTISFLRLRFANCLHAEGARLLSLFYTKTIVASMIEQE